MTRTHSGGNDHVGLVSRWRPGDRFPRLWIKTDIPDPPPGGVDLGTVPVVPAASAAFSPAELAARLEALAELHAAGLAADPDQGAVICWACGRRPPRRTGTSARAAGWRSRTLSFFGFPNLREVYCADCFARWGWPDEQGGRAVEGGAA